MEFPKKVQNIKCFSTDKKTQETLILFNGKVHELNEVAHTIFNYCDGLHSLDSIAKIISDLYEVQFKRAQTDVLSVVREFIRIGLVEVEAQTLDKNEKPTTEVESVSELSDKLYKKAWDECIPLYVVFEITQKCNLKCHHCYNFDRNTPEKRQTKEPWLSSEKIYQVIDELSQAGNLYLTFTGGEALVHPQFFDFVKFAKNKGLRVRVKSNGMLLTEENVLKMKEMGVESVDISLYGMTPESHEKLTLRSRSFEKTIKGIKTAKRNGLNPKISFIVHRYNCHEIGLVKEFSKSNQIECFFSTELTARYDGTSSSRSLRVTKEQYRELLSGPHRDLFNQVNASGSLQCACARINCGITATGNVYPCIGAPIDSGSLKEKNFLEIWKNSEKLNAIRNLKAEDFRSCFTCKDRFYCHRSSGGIYVDTGNYTGPEEQTCLEASLRHESYRSGNSFRVSSSVKNETMS